MTSPHVVSQPLAIALQDAGYPQENALYYWVKKADGYSVHTIGEVRGYANEMVAAPLTSEMLEELPAELNIPYKNGRKRKQDHYLYIRKLAEGWRVRYYANKYNDNPTGYDESLPDACAKLWLHLKSAGLLTP